jgi:hypothetical protein
MIETRGIRGAVRASTVCLAFVLTTLVLATAAAAKPAGGTYSGTTSEKGTVSFIVTSDGKDVVTFTTSDGYNGGCHFHGGAGGMKNFTVNVALIPLSASGNFTGSVKESNKPFKGSTTIQIKGRINGSHASGTLDVPADKCGSGAANPSAPLYRETFTATRS